MNVTGRLKKTKTYLLKEIKTNPKIAVITGSGLDGIKDFLKSKKTIPYSKIPYFKPTTVAGHSGELICGTYKNTDILVLNGRLHFYEGNSMREISYPVRVLKELGVTRLIITCAAGAINEKYAVGDIVAVTDHINFTGDNPLIGPHFVQFGERFPDISSVYDKDLIKKAKKIAAANKIKLRTGIYFAVKGPSYETPAEISAFRKLGGDVVGMSLIAEAITAAQSGIKVLAVVYVSNKAAGTSKREISHKDVLKTGRKAAISVTNIIKNITGDFE